jgi:hypothetical protein
MTLRYFAITLKSENAITKEEQSRVSDFNFQTTYLSYYLSWALRKQKFETKGFNMLLIRGSKSPEPLPILKEHFKSLNVEVFFEESKYTALYPEANVYPLTGLLKPLENEAAFNDFLFSMVVNGLETVKSTETLPYEFLVNTLLDFRMNGCKTEWVHQKKTIRSKGLKVSLVCRLTANYFSLGLIVENNKSEIFKKELLKTLPNQDHYSTEFKNIVIEDERITVTKNDDGKTLLFTLPFSELPQ